MAGALAPLKCNVIQSTSDEAPGQLTDVESHLGGHHSPDLFQVQHEPSKAVAAPMAAKQQATAKAVTMAEEQLTHVQEHTQNDGVHPGKRGLGHPPKVAPSLAPATQEVEVPRQAGQRLTG